MGIEVDRFERALERAAAADVLMTVHAEDAELFDESATDRDDADAWSAYRTAEAEAEAIDRACAAARNLATDIHVAHTSTPQGVDIAEKAGMTCEATPHHLFLSRDDLDDLGTLGRSNSASRRDSLRSGGFIRPSVPSSARSSRDRKRWCGVASQVIPAFSAMSTPSGVDVWAT